MSIKLFMLALAGASLAATAPTLAQGRGGGHGKGHGAAHGKMGGRIDARVDRNHGIDARAEARRNSRGPDRASDRAIERANDNSVLRSRARTSTDLQLLRTGLTMQTSSGVTLGTIRRVNRSRDGIVRNVLVRSRTGMRTIPVSPATISISGDVVTTTGARPRGGR